MSARFPDILGTNDAAKLCGFSRQRLYQLREDGRFPEPDVKVGPHPFWHRQSIYEFLDTWTSPRPTGRKGLPRPTPLSTSS